MPLLIHPPSPHRADLRLTWRRFPAALRGLMLEVREESAAILNAGRAGHAPIEGYSVENAVYVLDCEHAAFVFGHELGHVVHARLMTPAQRADWNAYWRQHPGRMPRDYSRTSAEEGIADCFGALMAVRVPAWVGRVDSVTAAKVRGYVK